MSSASPAAAEKFAPVVASSEGTRAACSSYYFTGKEGDVRGSRTE